MGTVGNVNPVRVKPPLITGLIYAFIFMAICTLVFSFMLWLSDISEHTLSSAAFVIHGVSVLAGGFAAGRHSLRKGWLNGSYVGIIYSLIVFLIGYLGFDAGLHLETFILTAICVASAAVGGILGVNTRK